ncbi:hypothetical protein SPAN111604_09405 [Sphingomonas antarctica]|uniref:hypothetical protein n=1 Tax=Sphingomonas antarctica TaxID=2040274 RepID=UPI0039EC4E70
MITNAELQRMAAPILILCMLAWYSVTRAHVPSTSSVNGTYSNLCCDSIILRDGSIITDGRRAAFDLENMKFGLTAYPSKRVQVSDGHIVVQDDPDPGPLSFSQNGTELTICGDRLCRTTYIFKRR